MSRDVFGGGKRVRDAATRILLYEYEAIRIAKYAQSSPGIEIGGDLLGFYAPTGNPLVFIASGPGPTARRDATHFQQDPQYQATIFNHLALKFRMFYVGDWHSHHGLGLSEPSGSDDAKLQDLSAKNGWPRLFSLIVQTELARGRFGGPGGPIEGFGIWWNAFQYAFDETGPVRHRVQIEFQSGENPYAAESDRITPTRETRSDLRGYEAGASATTDFRVPEVHGGAAASGDEFTINIYQKICRGLSDELPRVEMEVDLEYPGGPRLAILDGDKKVACSILNSGDVSLAVMVDPAGGKQLTFKVPRSRGQVDPVAIRTIVQRIMEQFKPPNDPGQPGANAVPLDSSTRQQRKK